MSVDPETLSGRQERGYFSELAMSESLDEDIVDHLWTPNGNRRKKRDGVVLRGVFDPIEVINGIDGLPIGQFMRRVDGNRRKYHLSRFINMAASINRLIGAQFGQITMYRAPTDGIEAHIDYDSIGEDINCRRSGGAVLSLGLRGRRYFGLSPILRHWQVMDAEVYSEDGNAPKIGDMRTVICQSPGDVIVIPEGIVHAVVAEKDSSAVLIAQRNRYPAA